MHEMGSKSTNVGSHEIIGSFVWSSLVIITVYVGGVTEA